jgi:hypothetical protein
MTIGLIFDSVKIAGGIEAIGALSLVTGGGWFLLESFFMRKSLPFFTRLTLCGVGYFLLFSFLERLIAGFNIPWVSFSYQGQFSWLIILFGIFAILHTILSLLYSFSYEPFSRSSHSSHHH